MRRTDLHENHHSNMNVQLLLVQLKVSILRQSYIWNPT